MVRGNWQKRVELAAARRSEQKDRMTARQEKDRNGNFNQKCIRNFLSWLDENNPRMRSRVYVWVTKRPMTEAIIDVQHSGPDASHSKKSDKKLHPRSHAKTEGTAKEDDVPNCTLGCCRTSFFLGICTGSKSRSKKGKRKDDETDDDCISGLVHVRIQLFETLSKENQTSLEVLKKSALCAPLPIGVKLKSIPIDDNEASVSLDDPMEILYCVTVDVDVLDFATLLDIKSPSIQIQRALTDEEVSLQNVVYVTFDGIFAYDRNLGGNLLAEVKNDSTTEITVEESENLMVNERMDESTSQDMTSDTLQKKKKRLPSTKKKDGFARGMSLRG